MAGKSYITFIAQNVEIKSLRDKRTLVNGKNKEMRQFSIIIPNVYSPDEVDPITGEVINNDNNVEHQELEILCSAFQPEHIAFLEKCKVGDFISIEGIPQPVWKGYFSDGSKEGERFTIPDIGRPPGKSNRGRDIPPKAKPYRMDKQTPGLCVYAAVPTITLMKIEGELDTNDGATGDSKALDNLLDQQEDLNQAVNSNTPTKGTPPPAENPPPPEEYEDY